MIGAVIWVVYTWYFQQELRMKQEFIAPYMWLYNSYTWEVKKVSRKDEFLDIYEIQLLQIEDREAPDMMHHLLRIPKNFALTPGETIRYSGKMYPIEDFGNFSYEKFLLSQNIYFSTSTNNSSQVVAPSQWLFLWMFELREELLARIGILFPKEEAIFLGGILFWARESLPQELKEDFNNSWLTHFIAVSGFNITLCVIFVTFIFWFLPAWGRVFVVSVSISMFSLFVGLWAPVVRAALMGILGYMFLQTGNSVKNMTLLAFVAVCMTALNPLTLVYDVSFQLSFLAVIGIMYTQEFLEKIFRWVPSIFAIREAFVLTIAALSFTLPLMVFQFGQVSLLAPLANIAVTWTIPLAMLWGALTVMVDMFSHEIAIIIGFFEWALLHYDMLMVNFFGNQSWAVLNIDFWVYQYYFEAIYFLLLTYIVTLYHIRKQ